MDQQLEPTPTTTPIIPLGAAEYFVEIRTPYRWSSGPDVITLDPTNNHAPFASLEAAKTYAEYRHQPSYRENSTEASYGVRYVTKLDTKIHIPRRVHQPTLENNDMPDILP